MGLSIFIGIIVLFILIKVCWVIWGGFGYGNRQKERRDILERRNWLLDKVMVEPEQLLHSMPKEVGEQFQGEWALYSCSMLAKSLANIAEIYPETRLEAISHIDSLIQIVMSPSIRRYDAMRWGEDPLETLDGAESHVSYLSHLAWMMGNYKMIGGDDRYDTLYDQVCEAMDRRIRQSDILNIPTYPGEAIYIPDMMVAIVALSDYSKLNRGKFGETVQLWINRAHREWVDEQTGLLVSCLDYRGKAETRPKGSYSALNCYYLSLIDPQFAKEQYEKLKVTFKQVLPLTGIKEFLDRTCWFGMDIDAGPIVCNLTPSGTAFAIGAATFFEDKAFRNSLLRTAEIVGHTISISGRRHYLLADIVPVGEAIALAMRTNINMTNKGF